MENKTANGKPLWTIVKDGNNQEYKVINFDNPEAVPSKGLKVVRAIKKSSRHQPASVFRAVRDPQTDIWYGIPAGIHETTKNLRFLSIEINDMRQYDLANPQDRMEWAVVSRAPFLRDSPFAKGLRPSHYVEDVEADAEVKIQNIEEKEQAYQTVKGMSLAQIVDMARNVGGIDTRNSSLTVIKANLLDFVDSKEKDKGAKKFNEIWKMTNRDAFTVFHRCKHVGLVSFDLTNGWLWKKSNQLGTTEPMAIEYMTKNPSLLMAMDGESKVKDETFQAVATEEEKTKVATPAPLHKNVDDNILKELAEDRARVKAKEDRLDALLAKAEKLVPVDLDLKLESFVPPTLEQLQQEAKKRGMKQAGVVTDVAVLHKWIEDHPLTAKE